VQLSVRELAPLLEVSEKTIYRWIRDRKIPAFRVGDLYRFDRAEIVEWAQTRRITVSPAILSEPRQTARLSTLGDALLVGGTGRDEALSRVANLLRLPDGVDRALLGRALIARENLASTGVGAGIAVPHPRTPLPIQLDVAALGLCFLDQPVEFGAQDGRPVTTLFVLVSPSLPAHLHLLSRLGLVLRHAAVIEALKARPARDVLMAALAAAESTLVDLSDGAPT